MRPSKIIELSLMWTGEKVIPPVINIDDCHPINFQKHDGYINGFYGFHARGKGAQYCALAADSLGLKFALVNVCIQIERDIKLGAVSPQDLQNVDMLNMGRASRSLIEIVAEFFYTRLIQKGWAKEDIEKINWRFAEHFMPVDESIVSDLLKHPFFSHLRVFVYQAKPIRDPGVIHAPIFFGVAKRDCMVKAFSPMYPKLQIVGPDGQPL